MKTFKPALLLALLTSFNGCSDSGGITSGGSAGSGSAGVGGTSVSTGGTSVSTGGTSVNAGTAASSGTAANSGSVGEAGISGAAGSATGGVGGTSGSGSEIWIRSELLYEDSFDTVDSLDSWLSVFDAPDNSSIELKDGKLDVVSSLGGTIWFTPVLTGNILIEYDIAMQDAGGSYDRVSDLNQYWMAFDPTKTDWLGDKHDGLARYYVGMGGNNNTTTRFRKYNTDLTDNLLGEFTDVSHLLSGNVIYHIEIIGFEGLVQFRVDGEIYFSFDDPNPYTEGRFGFRVLKNHETIDNFKVYQLSASQ